MVHKNVVVIMALAASVSKNEGTNYKNHNDLSLYFNT